MTIQYSSLKEVYIYVKIKLFINVEIKDLQIKETFNNIIKLVEDYLKNIILKFHYFKLGYYRNYI